MKFCIKSKLEKKFSSWKKSLFKKYVIHKITRNISKNKIDIFFDNFTRLVAFLVMVKLNLIEILKIE